MQSETHSLVHPQGARLVFDHHRPRTDAPSPPCTLVFVHGLASDRRGEKCYALAERFTAEGAHCFALDLHGHGESEGTLTDFSLRRALDDLQLLVDAIERAPGANAPLVLVGSSMGAAVAAWWLARTKRQDLAQRALFVGIAPAFFFPARLLSELPPEALRAWEQSGTFCLPSAWAQITLGRALLADARSFDPQQLEQHRAPTLLIQGMEDDAVPWESVVNFCGRASQTSQLRFWLIRGGDHRLNAHKEAIAEVAWRFVQGVLASSGASGG